ncbi:hypothetical protein MQ083_09380 [Edwardsiella anguillarum]|nr:hypothetical protein [Edwardsiella anguillarum]WHQ12551.1 hypothetical protein MQ083_09380 [Edwardsiella anguillarum]WHQ19258.1 hypothetical protein MQ085_07985 [Edwardsiella anguillarum]WHQ26326.1 hypothetical protein MQ094_07985 [Edwardsiella anguillarum]WHQ29841.1 hypothetical protein MQ093_07960 [Edwardsiella anguillarum]
MRVKENQRVSAGKMNAAAAAENATHGNLFQHKHDQFSADRFISVRHVVH